MGPTSVHINYDKHDKFRVFINEVIKSSTNQNHAIARYMQPECQLCS